MTPTPREFFQNSAAMRFHEAGICPVCGKPSDTGGSAKCRECHAKAVAEMRARLEAPAGKSNETEE